VERLRAEPGLVVLSAGRQSGKFFVAGLRDPLALDPATLLASSGVNPDSIDSRWEPYQALQPSFVMARATDLLRPPDGVTFSYRDGLLIARGQAPARWIADSERIAPAIAGVRRFQYDGRAPQLVIKDKLEAFAVVFLKGTSTLAPGQEASIGAMIDLLHELDETARAEGRKVQIDVRGHTDSDGSDTLNGPLSQARGRVLHAALDTGRFGALAFSVAGAGSEDPITTGTTEEEKARNRRAAVRVRLPGGDAPQPTRP
jgi:OOP family OmpA-OmpF porin